MLRPRRLHEDALDKYLLQNKQSLLDNFKEYSPKKEYRNIESKASSNEEGVCQISTGKQNLSVVELITKLLVDDFGLKLLELLIISERANFADQLHIMLLPDIWMHFKNKNMISLIKTMIKYCSDSCRIQFFKKVRGSLLEVSTDQGTTQIIQEMIESANQFLLESVLEVSMTFFKELVKTIGGFFIFIKLADSLSEVGRNEMLLTISTFPEAAKSKQGYLIINKLIKKGVDRETKDIFLNSVKEMKMSLNRNVKKLMKLVA